MPHHEDDDLAMNTTTLLREQRMKEYGGLNLPIFVRFERPFGHLNHLHTVVSNDASAIMDVRGEPSVSPSAFHVMSITWERIERACEECGYDIFGAIGSRGILFLEDMARLRRDLAKLEAGFLGAQRRGTNAEHVFYVADIPALYERDYSYIIERDQEYGASWIKRGGVGAFMMLARKWDRFAPMTKTFDGLPLKMLAHKPDRIDDVQDLRRYLMLVQSEWLRRQAA